MKGFLVGILPRWFKAWLKYIRRTPQRVAVQKQRAAGNVVRKSDIVSGLRKLGIKKGDTLMVHSSLSSFGYVEGGARTVIDVLLELVGSKGNVCMPSFGPLPDNKTFDARTAKSALGKISDVFWRLPEAVRSLAPTHNVACIGPKAGVVCGKHHLDRTPFGKNSPYCKMLDLDAWLLVLGSYLGRVTVYHVLEDELGVKFPIKVYLPKAKKFDVIDSSGRKLVVETLVHDTALNPRRIDNNLAVGERIKSDLIRLGYMKVGKIGDAEILAIKIPLLLKALRAFLKEGKTIYASNEEMQN